MGKIIHLPSRSGVIETVDVLGYFYPKANFSTRGEEYSDITWNENNEDEKPSESELEDKKLEFKG